jgi:hypothetical protein
MAIDPALTKLNLYTKSRSESLFNLNLPVVNIENLEEISASLRAMGHSTHEVSREL